MGHLYSAVSISNTCYIDDYVISFEVLVEVTLSTKQSVC